MKNTRLNALTRSAIEQAAHRLQPKTVQAWAVDVDENRFPVKQLVRAAANQLEMLENLVTPADFNSHQAAKILEDNGFDVKYLG